MTGVQTCALPIYELAETLQLTTCEQASEETDDLNYHPDNPWLACFERQGGIMEATATIVVVLDGKTLPGCYQQQL